jgi:hypothetical protein
MAARAERGDVEQVLPLEGLPVALEEAAGFLRVEEDQAQILHGSLRLGVRCRAHW